MADIEVYAVPTVVGSLVMAVMKWLLGREVERIDKHGERIEELERYTATKSDLDAQSKTIVQVIERSSRDVIERIGEVRNVAEKAHARLDQQQADEIARLRAMQR